MKWTIMSVLTVWVLVSSMFIGLITFSDIEYVEAPYIPHSPFRINSNAEFASMAGIEGWVGNGLPGSPYIIEGYDINGSGYGYCIYIGNTTVYFEVKDSYLHETNGGGNQPYHSDSGLILYNVQNGIITNNTATSNKMWGFYLYSSYNNTIANNTASSNNGDGIYVIHSNKITITNNTASSNICDGIVISYSDCNTFANNTISQNDRYGIYLHKSSNDTFVNNEMTGNGIYFWSDILENWNTHIIDTTNTVNGKPVRYWKNQTGGTVPLGAGQVILANCTNVKVVNQNVSDCSAGIQLGLSSNNTIANNTASNNYHSIHLLYSQDNTIANNTVSDNYWGIYLPESSSNTITYNNVSNNEYGIDLFYSNSNIIANNNASNNSRGINLWVSSDNTIANNNVLNNWWGIRLMPGSNGNTITNNTVSNNEFGIHIDNSLDDSIYHNNIINNANQAYDDTNNGNQWDSGYPSGGNFWSDYIGSDYFSGPNQDQPGSDGIGDTNYSIDSDSVDNYPLMSPVGPFIFLYLGWNLISIPFIQSDTELDTVLSSINGSYDAVQWYNNSDTSDPWKHNQISKPSNLNDLNSIDHTIGFWIHITEPGGVMFEYPGTQPTSNQSIPLHPGWNIVGYPSLSNKNRTAALNNITFGLEVDAIWTFNAANKKWEEIGVGDLFLIGKGYWIHAIEECIWELPV